MNVLVFGAHPDDFEVGMGGTIARYTNAGHRVTCVICVIPNMFEIRREESLKSAKVLDVELLFIDSNPEDFRLTRKLVKDFDSIINDCNPDLIFTHWHLDSHQDHRIVAEATFASARKNASSLYMYEQMIPGGIMPYGFKSQMFVDVTDTIDTKIESVSCHESQMKRLNPDSMWENGITGRAAYRGYPINVKYAEAFEVVKELKEIN